MLKKLGKNITIVNVIIFIIVMLVGGVSIFLAQRILHNGYKIQQEGEDIARVDDLYSYAYRLVLDMHHFLIHPHKEHVEYSTSLMKEIKIKTEEYKADELTTKIKEHDKEIKLLDEILEDIKGLEGLLLVFEEFERSGTFDKDKVFELEGYAYDIEQTVRDINQIHFSNITKWQRESITIMWVILLLYLMFIMIGCISIYIGHRILTKKVVEPIIKLAHTTLEFSEGTFDKRVYTNSTTEIGLLYQSFNKMADKIQEHNEFLRKFNEELEKKVKERTHELQKANLQLKKTHDALIRAEKIAAIGQIATGVTHEVKTPLNSLSINIQMLLREIKDKCGTDECEFYEVANLIQCEVRRINNILDSFVGFARFPEPRFMQNDINQIIKEVVMFISPDAKGAGVTIDLSLSDSIPVFKFDRPQIKEVLMNLFQNAVHAMPHGGMLKIITSMRGDNVVVEVSDTGIGISEKNMDKIFTPFFSTKDRGLGLGLAIVQRIIEGHGGSISCSSKVGKGTVFEIVLPIERD